MAQCKATAKSTGERCNRRAVEGREVCTVHGGLTPRGIASPHTKHGRYYGQMPANLSALVEKGADDPDLLNLSSEIEVLDGMIRESMGRLEEGGDEKAWRELVKVQTKIRKAEVTGDVTKLREALVDLDGVIREGSSYYAARADLVRLFEQRRKLVESEAKRRERMSMMVRAERIVLMMRSLGHLVRENVKDERALRRINEGMARILRDGTEG